MVIVSPSGALWPPALTARPVISVVRSSAGSTIDRDAYQSEIAIMNLHEKLDHLLHTQWERLLELQQIQIDMLSDLEQRRRS